MKDMGYNSVKVI